MANFSEENSFPPRVRPDAAEIDGSAAIVRVDASYEHRSRLLRLDGCHRGGVLARRRQNIRGRVGAESVSGQDTQCERACIGMEAAQVGLREVLVGRRLNGNVEDILGRDDEHYDCEHGGGRKG